MRVCDSHLHGVFAPMLGSSVCELLLARLVSWVAMVCAAAVYSDPAAAAAFDTVHGYVRTCGVTCCEKETAPSMQSKQPASPDPCTGSARLACTQSCLGVC
jgi:hypothetical protein